MNASTRLYLWIKFFMVLHIVEEMMFGMSDLKTARVLLAHFESWVGDAGKAYVMLAAISGILAIVGTYCVLIGGLARFTALFILGLPALSEVLHLVETVRAGHYTPGVVTAVPNIVLAVLFLRAVTLEFRAPKPAEPQDGPQLMDRSAIPGGCYAYDTQ